MNADGTEERRLTNSPGANYFPVWSPDGTQLIFHSNRDDNYEIYRINLDGSDETRLTNNDIVKELHHCMIAGYTLGLVMAWGIKMLGEHPTVYTQLTKTCMQSKNQPVHSNKIAKELLHFILEIKRTSPTISGSMPGKAKRDFRINNMFVPKGWSLFWAMSSHHNSPHVSLFDDPQRFDPERFSKPRCEHQRHEYAFVPQGAGDPSTTHACPAIDYTTQILHVFFLELLQVRPFRLVSPHVPYNDNTMPPQPHDGLQVRFTDQPPA